MTFKFYFGDTNKEITLEFAGKFKRRVNKLYGFVIGSTFIGIMRVSESLSVTLMENE
jgi:hypothetical protein